MYYTKENIPALESVVDFEKAFDTFEWKYMYMYSKLYTDIANKQVNLA